MAGERSFTSLGERLIELEVAWRDRLADSEHLTAIGRNCSAISMGLYALEILLKVKICQRLELKRLPKPFEIHDLAGLMLVAGLTHRLVKNRRVKKNWTKVLEMSAHLNELRYRPNDFKSQLQAAEFLAQLDDKQDGVLTWILKQD